MHKKRIHNRDYYYTSYRGEDGKVCSKYLGNDEKSALKKESRLQSGFRGDLYVYCLIFLLLGVCFFGGMFSYTGFVTYEGGVDLAWNESWDVDSSFVRVSLGTDVYDIPVSVVDGSVVVDLSVFDFNSTGVGYVDLVVNESVVDSASFEIEELYSLNESLSAQNLTLNDAELNNSVDGLNTTGDSVNETVEESLNVSEDVNETVEESLNITEAVNETVEDDLNESLDVVEEVNETVEENLNESLDVVEDVPIVNLTANETVEEVVNISLNITEEVNVTNQTVQNVTVIAGVNVSEEVTQYGAVIGEPVKWKKKLVASSGIANLIVDIPDTAENVSVKKIVDNVETVLEDVLVNSSGVITDLDQSDLVDSPTGFFSMVTGMFSASITGMFVAEDVQENISLIIEEEVEEVEVEYYTEAPSAVEEDTVYGKKVVVSSETHYENILTYTTIPETAPGAVKLYWIVNGSRVVHPFDGYDTNADGLVDYLEWVTPHTSEQEFEIDLTILNVQSYPVVGGSWIVMFNTTGTADLSVRAINDTYFGVDLEFLEIRCGNETVDTTYNGSIFVEDYSCNETGYEESKVLTSGVHELEFTFGNVTAYAYNDASYPNCPGDTASGNWVISASNTTSTDVICNTIVINNSATFTINTLTNGSLIELRANNISIASGASVSTNSKGCPSTQSPSAGSGCSSTQSTAPGYGEGEDDAYDGGAGAGYGGRGGDRDNDGESGGYAYGTALTPNLMGSGGGAGDGAGGVGGGAVLINASDTFTLNGTVTATGGNGVAAADAGGGGSGGAIWVITDTMKGTGSFSANGGTGGTGDPDHGGGGAGGRIAVHFNTLEDLDITSSTVTGGTGPGGAGDGDDGTIGFIDIDDDTLTISKGWEFQKNVNYTNITVYNSLVAINSSVRVNISDLYSKGYFNITCWSSAYDFELNVSNDANFSKFRMKNLGTGGVDCDKVDINASINSLSDFPEFTIEANDNVSLDLGDNVNISDGTITLNNKLNWFFILTPTNLTLENTAVTGNLDWLLTNLSIDASSSLSANSRGCTSTQSPISLYTCSSTQSTAPGYGEGEDDAYDGGAGAGYGGRGGDRDNDGESGGYAYGTALTPNLMGSGGGSGDNTNGGVGGGLIKINVTDTFTLNGTVSSTGGNGVNDYDASGGGSGGAIWVITDTMKGTGSFSANGGTGGDGGSDDGGGGSGGRIAVHFNYLEDLDITSSTVTGGTGPGDAGDGDDGTIGFIDIDDDTLTISKGWEFQKNVNYTNITVYNSLVAINSSVRVNISDLYSKGYFNITCWSSAYDFELNVSNDANFSKFRMKNLGTGGVDCDKVDINASINSLTGFSEFVIEANDNITLDLGTNVTINSGTLTCNNDRDFVFFRTSPILRLESSTITANVDLTLGNFTLDSGSSINTNGKGFGGGSTTQTGSGPGGGTGDGGDSGSGAGYGGYGDIGYNNVDSGDRYGSALEPYNHGSGGGGGQYCTGSDGGGMVKINVSDIFELNGSITVNGADRAGCDDYDEGGAGSGGAVWLITDIMRGTGSMTADGGTASGTGQGGGGSGGRVAVHFNTLEDLDITSSSVTGGSGYNSDKGDQGSLGFIDEDDDTLTIYEGWDFNENINYTNITVYNSFVKLNKSLRLNISDLYSYGDLNITCWGSGNDFEFNITGEGNFSNFRMKNYGNGGSDCDNIHINASITNHTYFGNFLIESNGNITLDLGTNVTINSGTLTCNNDRDFVFFRTNPILRFESSTITANVDLTLGNFTLDSGSSINTNGKGFGGGATTTTGSGPGGGTGDGGESGSGAGHGGYGDIGYNNVDSGDRYGSALEPYNHGSGGGGGQYCTGSDGGGMVKINVSDIFELNGSITVNGADRAGCDSDDEGGAGSGGSVWLITDIMRGTGSMTADGGTASGSNQGGGGAGGRIAAHFNTLEDLDITSSSVTGGSGYNSDKGDQGSLGFIDEDDDTLTIYEGWDFNENINYTNITVYNSFVKLNKSLRLNISDLYNYGDLNITCWGSGNDFEFNITGEGNFSNFRMKNYGNGGSDCDNIHINASITNHTYFGNFLIESNGNITLDLGTNVTINSGTLTCNNDRDFVFFRTSPILRFESSTINANVDWILSNFTLDSGSSINTNGKGFGGGSTTQTGSGPGGGGGDGGESGTGASHGGVGGQGWSGPSTSAAYGSISAPYDHGSGGGGGQYCAGTDGGGYIKINVSDISILNGTIKASGVDRSACDANDEGGAGSGGAIWLITDTLHGGSLLNVSGGSAYGSAQGGGGAGGRITVYYATGEFNGTLWAKGGTGYNSGGAGTRLKVKGLSNMEFSGDSDGNLFARNSSVELKTNFSSAQSVEINRTVLTIWNNTLVHFNDSASTGVTASYNVTGLVATTNYSVENNSIEIAASPIQTYATGNLPLFSVVLNSPHEVKVQELVTPVINSYNTFNNTGGIVDEDNSLNYNENVTFNVSITQGSNPVSAVWVVIWNTVYDGSEYANELMTTDGVNYTVNVYINNSLYSLVNYTVYSNDSLNYQSYSESNFSLTLPPRIDSTTVYDGTYMENVTVSANASGSGLVGVNFTLTRYNDNTKLLDNVASSVNSSVLYNSSSVNLSQCTEYNYSVLVWNTGGLSTTTTGNITLACVDVNLNVTTVAVGGNVELYGIVNLTNGTVVVDNTLAIFQNEVANSSVAVPGWDNGNFSYRMNFTFTQPNNFSSRSGEHVLVNATFVEERVRNATGTMLYCNGSQVAFDAYALTTSNGWVTRLEGLAEVNFTGDSNLTCQLYYDPGYNGTISPLVNTGWHYICDNNYNVCGTPGDISTSTYDHNAKYATVQSADFRCNGDADTHTTNMWCYFKGQSSASVTFSTASDDGSHMYINGTQVVNNGYCQGTTCRTGTFTTVTGQYYPMEVTHDESGGGNTLYVDYGGCTSNDIDTECFPYYGDEWLIKVVNTSEESYGVGVQTNDTGGYNYTITANSGGGTFAIKINTTFAGLYGWSFANLVVYQVPVIDSVTFVTDQQYGKNVSLQANITDDNLAGVNFTIVRSDGIVGLNNELGTNGTALSWNSTSVNLTQCTDYNYTVFAWDVEGYNVTSYGNISLLCVEVNLNATVVAVNGSVEVSGIVNLTNGTAVANTEVNIYLNETLKTSDIDLGDGSDGSVTISGTNIQINNYTYLTLNESVGNLTLTVNDSSEFAADDEILIIQMQNGTVGSGLAGQYEFADIASISGNNLTLTSALNNTYGTGGFDSVNASVAQVIRVPQYVNISITGSVVAPAWDGYQGGIVIFKAQDVVNVSGSVNVSEKGFRGGDGDSNNGNRFSYQGESYGGLGSTDETSTYLPNLGGGGGGEDDDDTDSAEATPGGGGGYGTAGSEGQVECNINDQNGMAGSVYGVGDLSRIFLGSGGGGAGTEKSYSATYQSDGGAGGGIIMVYGNKIETFSSSDIVSDGQRPPIKTWDGGGGGSGGSIYLYASNISLSTSTVNASGGYGGATSSSSDCSNSNYGGAGGDGRVKLSFTSLTGTADPVAVNGSFSNVITTNSSGWYSLNLTVNDTTGLQTVKVNTTFAGLYGEGYVNLNVVQAPTVTLGSPVNANYSVALESVYFNCSVTDGDGDLANVTLYHNLGGTWGANGTRTVSGSSNESIFVENIKSFTSSSVWDSNFVWNCYARDTNNLVSSASSNATFGSWDLGNYSEDTVMNTTNSFVGLDDNDSKQEISSDWVNTSGLVLLYHFNNDSGYSENDKRNTSNSIYDFSGLSNNGSLGNTTAGTNPIWNVSGKLTGGYSFDGVDDYIDVGTDLSLNLSFGTFMTWFNSDSVSGYNMIYAKQATDANDAQYILYVVDGVLSLGGFSEDAWKSSVYSPISTNRWYQVVGVIDGSTIELYVDGVSVNSSVAGYMDSTPGPLNIGRRAWTASCGHFDGNIDEVAIWNRSLSAAEILEMYDRQKGIYVDKANYTSRVFDAGRNSTWTNITWDENVPYGEELPSIQGVETGLGGANMTGNVLLLHFNNDSSYSENDQRNVSNSVYDFSGSGNNGSLGNATAGTNPVVATGRIGSGYEFDGKRNQIDIGNSNSFDFGSSDDFTLSAWIYRDSTGISHTIFDRRSNTAGFLMGVHSSNTVRMYLKDASANSVEITSATEIDANKWYHVLAVYDRDGNGQLYVNGILDNQTSISSVSDSISNDEDLIIGFHSLNIASGWVYFNGTIDEVAIWNRTLSAAEVLNIYKRGALNLNLSARSCDDSSCSGGSWTNIGGNASLESMSLPTNRYFQYQLAYEAYDTDYSPELNLSTVVAGYDVINRAPQVTNVTMNSTSGFNYSNSSLQTYWKIWDADSDSETGSWTWWWKDGTKQSALENESSITADNLTKGEKWNMSVRLSDSLDWSNWSDNVTITIANTPPNYSLLTPTNAQLLLRSVSPQLNISFTDPDSDPINVSFINDSDDVILCQVNNSNKTSACVWPGLNPAMVYSWYANISDGDDVVQTDTFNFTPNNEPSVLNMRLEMVNASAIMFAWENEPDMSWVSLRIGSEILELRSITSTNDNWTVYNIYPDQEYVFEWQTGDDLLALSDYHNFTFRTFGWNTYLTNYTYRRLVTVNQSNVSSDDEDRGINITLTEDNFQYFDSTNWVWYPSFTRMNWSNHQDFRFVDYKDKNLLPYNITYWNVPGLGGVSTQTPPNATAESGSWVDYNKSHDEDWSTQATPSAYGEYYYNYTIPVGAKNGSKYRIYDGAWGWDLTLPVGCFGGSDLQFKTVSNYSIPGVNTYCWNNTGSSWAFVRNNGNVSAYVYETMMTWLFDCEVHITVIPEHYNDTNQTYNPGLDSDYDVKFWMYYGSLNATDNTTVLNYDGIEQNAYHLGAETARVLGTPEISNINDTVGRTTTGTNISWDTDQSCDHRIRYSDNKWFLNSTWYSSSVNVSETFTHLYGNDAHTVLLETYGDDYIRTLNVTCENPNYNTNYTINTSANPVSIVFADLDNATYFNWTVNYTWNKTNVRSAFSAEYELASLASNLTYYYEINVYGQNANNTANDTFTLGTVPSTPGLTILNYSEDRPNKQVTVCANLTNLNGEGSVNCSIQYWNQSSEYFMESSITSLDAIGTFCATIDVEYGQNYTYRAKGQASTIGYSLEYLNDYLAIQEFFAGSYIEDDNDDRDRQYCPDGPAIEPCYEQTGYLEGSLQEEDWIWIETNQSNRGNLTVNWWNGSVWTPYNMTNDTDSEMQYLKLEGLGSMFQTFYITNETDDLVFNWTKPSAIHLNNQNRTDESKYVAFNGTLAPVNYTLLYFDAKYYNSSAYQWCMAAPGGNLYDCMSVQYFGGGREGGWGSEYSGTKYDRGRMFRGGIANGELNDTGVLNLERRTNFTGTPDYRYCFAFTVYWWNESVVPNNNITNYYYHYWTQTDWWSDYFGYTQSRRFDYVSLFTWEYDLLSQTRDWSSIDETSMLTESIVLNVSNSTFGSPYNQSLVVGHHTGFAHDVRNDAIYDFGFYTDGRWTNQQFGQYQQGFIVFNLPPNATLQAMDTDNDSISDFDELFIYYTNPKHNDTDEDGRIDSDEINLSYDPNLFTQYGTAPSVAVPVLNRQRHYKNSSIVANTTYSDYDSDPATVYIVWYKNGVAIYNETKTGITNGTIINSTLSEGNFSKTDLINISIYAVDTFTQTSALVNTTSIVQNFVPLFNVSLGTKSVNSSSAFSYHFNCSDIDGDSIAYYDNTSLFEVNSSTGLISVALASQFDYGQHLINVTCGDGTDNKSQILTFTINDIEIPTISQSGSRFSSSTLFNITMSTNETAVCRYKNSTTNYSTMTATGSTNHRTDLTLSSGMNDYTIECNDSSANLNTSKAYVYVSSLSPNKANFNFTNFNTSDTAVFNLMDTLNASVDVTANSTSYILGAEYTSNPLGDNLSVDGSNVDALGYFVLETASEVRGNLTLASLKFGYSESDLTNLGITESDLTVYYYNDSADEWTEETVVANIELNYLELNISHMSVFFMGGVSVIPVVEAEEAGAAGGGGGGGGGGGARDREIMRVAEFYVPSNFSLSADEFTFDLAYEESKEDVLIITNNLGASQKFDLSTQYIGSVLTLSEHSFTLGPYESKEVTLHTVSDREPGVHVGSLIVKSSYETQVVPLVIEISSQIVLFDGTVYIPAEYKEITPGESIPVQITLFNIGSPRKVDVLLNYIISDINGNVIVEESETVGVEGQHSYTRDFYVPSDVADGTYVLGLEVVYVNSVATSSAMFDVVSDVKYGAPNMELGYVYVILGLVGIIALIGIIIVFRRKKGA